MNQETSINQRVCRFCSSRSLRFHFHPLKGGGMETQRRETGPMETTRKQSGNEQGRNGNGTETKAHFWKRERFHGGQKTGRFVSTFWPSVSMETAAASPLGRP